MIDHHMYNSLGMTKKAKPSSDFRSLEVSFKDLLSRSWGEITRPQAIAAYTFELKQILEEEELAQIVRKVFSLQSNITQLQKVTTGESEEWPTMDPFFRNLSPVFLQALYQYLSSGQTGKSVEPEEIIAQWVSALRVALEEEYYSWQEKLLDN